MGLHRHDRIDAVASSTQHNFVDTFLYLPVYSNREGEALSRDVEEVFGFGVPSLRRMPPPAR